MAATRTARRTVRQPVAHPTTLQLPLRFDASESARRQDAGALQALQAALPWAQRAEQWLAGRLEAFTSEALVAAIGLPTGGVGANRNNAVGALMRSWSARRLIWHVGYAPSRRVESHGARLAVWIPAAHLPELGGSR